MNITKQFIGTFLFILFVLPGLYVGISNSQTGNKVINGVSDSLHFIGHASFEIKTSDGKIIYIDPFQGTSADYTDSADIILVTHGHGDATLVSDQMSAGSYSKEWNALNMPSGIYFYSLQAGAFTDTKKFVLLK